MTSIKSDIATGQPYFCGHYIVNGPEIIAHVKILKRYYNSATDTEEILIIIEHTQSQQMYTL